MTDSRQFKVLEREPDEGRMDAALYQSSHDSTYADVYQSAVDAHDAAPSDLTEAVEALVRALDNEPRWALPPKVRLAFINLRENHPEFYKQAMEGGDAE